MDWRWLLLPLGMSTMQTASGAWLGICGNHPPSATARMLSDYLSPQQQHKGLLLDSAPLPDCAAVEIPFAHESVVAGRLVSPAFGTALSSGLVLIGNFAGQQFHISDIAPAAQQERLETIPLDVELSSRSDVMSFGAEERASALLSTDGITLACGAGHRAAGMVLRLPFRGLARAIPLSVSISYTANGMFEAGLSDLQRSSKGNPLALAKLFAGTATVQIDIPRQSLHADQVESFTFSCPLQAARLELRSLQIKPKAGHAGSPPRASWVWQAEKWMESPESLLDRYSKAGIGTLFVTVPIDPQQQTVRQPQALEAFVSAATKRGIKIWSVVGDPGMVMEDERALLARYPAAYTRYNANVPADAQLGGIQFDIEPYLNAGYALNPAVWFEAYLDALQRLKQASTLPIEVDVPFWWADQQTSKGPLMERLATVVDGVTVMNYRTDPVQIRSLAQPFLDWGTQHRRTVRIALESGPIGDEIQRHYVPADSGDLALVTVGSNLVLLELDQMQSVPPSSTARMFQFTHATPVPGSSTTFAGRRDVLLGLLPELETSWGAWPSFAGMALHEFSP